jgi:hypothetical protein
MGKGCCSSSLKLEYSTPLGSTKPASGKIMFRFRSDKKLKLILLAGGISLIFGGVYRYYPFFQDLLFPTTEIELKKGQIIKYQKLLEVESGLETSRENLTNALKTAEEGLFAGKTPTLTAVQIQDMLQRITEKSGVVIKRLQVLQPENFAKDMYLSIPVEFYMDATVSQLKEVLYRISAFQKYLAVRNLTLYFSGGKAGANIRCQITIAGYMKNPKS